MSEIKIGSGVPGVCMKALMVVAVLAMASASWAENHPATALMEQGIDKMFKFLAPLDDAEKFPIQKFVDILDEFVAFDFIARKVAGKHVPNMTTTQVKAFQSAFRYSLGSAYGSVLRTLDQRRISFLPLVDKDIKSETRAIVRTKIETDVGDVYNITYDVRELDGAWLLFNIIVVPERGQAFNLGKTYRSQFYSFMQRNENDVDKVIAKWQEQSNK